MRVALRGRGRRGSRDASLSMGEYANYFTFGGLAYALQQTQTLGGSKQEDIAANFAGYVQGAYRQNGVVFATMLVRFLLFSEARLTFRQLRQGRPAAMFGTPDLRLFENPWPNGTTGDLLTRMILDADLAGNFFGTRRLRSGGTRRSSEPRDRIVRMRPDWTTIVLGSNTDPDVDAADLDAELLGYLYHPGGRQSGRDPVPLLAEEVAHFAPVPDPTAQYRGMSWITPIVREILGDRAATDHKLEYFENGATPNLVVTLSENIQRESFEKWVDLFTEQTEAAPYGTLYLGAGATPTPVGSDLKSVDFKAVQAGGETRICMAGGVPPVIVGTSEGLESSTYSNYGQARRRLADGTMRPLWRNAAGSLATLIDEPNGAHLWYDDRDIAFLQDDHKDAAEVIAAEAQAIRTLVDGGYTPDSAAAAVMANDLGLLEHTGLYSVQLQPAGVLHEPGHPPAPAPAIGGSNGNGNGAGP